MKVLFYFGHPAQYLFLRETMRLLRTKGYGIIIVIKTKDVLEDLVKNDGFDYTNILPRERKKSKLSIAFSLLKRNVKLIPIVLKQKPDLMIGTDASIAQVGKLFGIKRIAITEDDYQVVKSLANITYPLTNTILCPDVCDVGKWEKKKVGYPGYMKLGYLHPGIFNPDKAVLDKYNLRGKYTLIRLAKLTAHHDFGINGINYEMLDEIISLVRKRGYKFFISAEDNINEEYQSYLLKINPADMHHILAFSSLLVSDSQSMSVEAAMLGVPSLRLSDFAGRISVLEELEHKYELTFGIKPDNSKSVFQKLDELLSMPDLHAEFQRRRKLMLAQKIDVTAFLVWFIGNYPLSIATLHQETKFMDRFK